MEINPVILNSLIISLCFILIDTLFGVLLAIKNKTLKVNELARFLSSAILPYMGSLIILGLGANFISELMPVFLTAVALVSAKFGIECIKEKLIILFK